MKKDQPNPFTKLDCLILTIIVVVAMVARLYKINTPLADLHSWRQADTAAVGRNFVRFGFDFLHPRYDDLSSNQSAAGLDNPQGLRFVEFPIYNAIFAYAYKLLPVLPIEVYGRLTTAFFSLIIIGVIYFLALKEANRLAAFFAAATYAVFPFFVFFSRVVLPETTATAFSLLAVFFLYLYSDRKGLAAGISFFLSVVSFAAAVLIMPTAGFYGLVLLFIFFKKFRFHFIKKWPVYLFFIIALIPFAWWRLYIRQFPEGIPPSEWLLTSVNTYQGLQNIFFRPAFFRWIFFERINNLMLGGYLTFFLLLGALVRPKRWILHSVLFSALIYLFTFQGGNVQHEYYQTIALPAIALFVGVGAAYLFTIRKLFVHPIINAGVVLFVFAISLFFSFYNVRGFYDYPAELPQIAKIINILTAPTDKIVTDRLGDTTLLYLADRRGAPSIYKDPAVLAKMGYSYLATLNQGEINTLKQQKYPVVFENNQFALFKL